MFEAGKKQVEPREVPIPDLVNFAERSFRPLANQKALDFTIEAQDKSIRWIRTDPLRLQQILTNLLGNAFKFTETGTVPLRIGTAQTERQFAHPELQEASKAFSFPVIVTGIGLPQDNH